MYIRLCEGSTYIKDGKEKYFYKTQMVKSMEEAIKIAKKKPEGDWYYSTYKYNEKHKKRHDEENSVKGVRDVTTNALWWDIDCAGDLEKARKIILEVSHRLIKKGFKEENLQLRYSGSKGYHLWVETDKQMTPEEVENITTNLSLDPSNKVTGLLEGFDTSMYDANQVLRLPLTVNKKSDLFCRPIKLSDVESLTDDEIKESAKDISSIDYKKVEKYYGTAKMPKDVYNLRTVAVKVKKAPEELLDFDIKKIDYSKKPSFLNNAEWALQQGYFRGSESASKTGDVGERDDSFLCLAAVYKKKGFDKISTYHLLKGVAELQASRTGEDRFQNDEIWEKVENVYHPEWKAGTHRIWLEEKYATKYNIPMVNYNADTKIVSIKQGFQNFIDYAKDIDEYRFEFGIPELDSKMKARTGYLIGMLAPPGMGKTSFAITALNNTSKMGKKSIVFSYDMAESVLFQKLLQRETGLDEDTIFNNIVSALKEDDKKARYRVKEWTKLLDENYENCTFVFKSGQTIKEIKQTIMETELAIGDSVPFIIVDYSELVQSQFSDPTQASAEVIQGLREIANEMNKLVFVLMQPNKMSSTPNEPLLSYNCAKGSSAIAQAVTMMITAHRPGYSSENPENDRFFSVNCVKNRMGQLFACDFGWDGPTGKISQISDSERTFLEQLRDMNKEQKEEKQNKKRFKDF
jgi:replicative DNA helicase